MKKLFIILVGLLSLVSCHRISPNADEEAALITKPIIWGKGGVVDEPVHSGSSWAWFTTEATYFKIVPVKHEIPMDDLFSDDNTPLDFKTIVITKIENGKTPILLKNYGEDWFDTNLKEYYMKLVRNYVSKYSPFQLMSNREVLDGIDAAVLKDLQQFIKLLSRDKEFPVKIRQVTIGKAIPNGEQLAEMNRTAKAIQAKQTQERLAEVEEAREKAERKRALADKAYQDELGLSTQDFISLKWIETIASKKDANIDVLVGGSDHTNMWNIRRR